MLARNAARFGARPAYRHKDRGIWQSWSWAEVNLTVRAYALALAELGLKRGDSFAIIGGNRPRLYWSFMAAQCLGAVPVPVYADAVADEMGYVLAHADARMAAVQDQEQVDKVIAVAERVPSLTLVFYDEAKGLSGYDKTRLLPLDEVIARGRAVLADPARAAWLDAEIAAGSGSDICVILYTSGTTGRAKGVQIGSARAIAAATDSVAMDKLAARDEVLAYLPLAWAGDHYLSYAQSMVAGFCISCPESANTVAENLREIGPSYYFAPPRVYENLLTATTVRMEDTGRLKRALYRHFIALAQRWGEKILVGTPVPFWVRLHYALGRFLVFEPLKNDLGLARVRLAYTAGEAIGPDLFSFFRSIGLNLKQFYGQTEAFIFLTAQPDGEIKPDTVGRVLPHVDLRLAESGEVQFKSPGQFVRYLKDEERTVEAMTADGYVKTGDAGFFDAMGHLHIIDRAKDVGHLRNGALFAPKFIENKLKFFPHIREAVAFGHERDFVTCLLNIDLTSVGNWAERNGVTYASYQELAANERVYDLLAEHVAAVNRDLAAEPALAATQIRRFVILHKELDADDGELTRTQKVRRSFIAERYAPLLAALYSGAREVDISAEVLFEDGRKGALSARLKIRDVVVKNSPIPVVTELAA